MVKMSKKWNLFNRKKTTKTDSHGTTLVDEEIQFQPNNPQWKSNSLKKNLTKVPGETFQRSDSGPHENEYENSEVARELGRTASNDLNPIEPRTTRTSPHVAKKLIKPGDKNASMLIPPNDPSSSISISDEYVDPFDALKTSGSSKALDGYIEPYEAQQIYQGITQTGETSSTEGKDKMYDDPWDKSKPKVDKDYEEPWDKTGTLPYKDMKGSSDSLSAMQGKQRMVFVPSQKRSPLSSPMLDRRLIRPPDTRSRAIDHRLIKAEPSADEIRRSRNRGSSGTNSPASKHSSPSHSPVSTLDHEHGLDQYRRASSPLVQPMNLPLYRLSKAKSQSLDMRNKQGLSTLRQKYGEGLPKSSSDDHLVQSAQPSIAPNKSLDGVREYEEPWDKETSISTRVSHSRSRSYELSSVPMHLNRHSKSRSFDKQEVYSDIRDYEPPWDQRTTQQGHLESMQRFQQRKLELHPSEAIGDKDFDPLLPLLKQGWYHGAMTRDQANMRLLREIEGSYLVRNSESTANNYSLSLRTRTTTIHMVISCTRDGFWILGEFSAPFHSIPEMIAFYAAHRLKINDVQYMSLKYPVTDDYL
uniref:SH2 domain-containing protein n=1 Tax=Ciona savignyi TaxID=51511 RepID=H2Z670_CIOSA